MCNSQSMFLEWCSATTAPNFSLFFCKMDWSVEFFLLLLFLFSNVKWVWMQVVWIRWLKKLIRCISNYYFQCFTTIHSMVHETFCWLTNTHMQAQFLGHMPFIIIDHLLNWEYSFFASLFYFFIFSLNYISTEIVALGNCFRGVLMWT